MARKKNAPGTRFPRVYDNPEAAATIALEQGEIVYQVDVPAILEPTTLYVVTKPGRDAHAYKYAIRQLGAHHTQSGTTAKLHAARGLTTEELRTKISALELEEVADLIATHPKAAALNSLIMSRTGPRRDKNRGK